MKSWKMKAADFYDLLIREQDFHCYLSGKMLTPDTVRVVKINPNAKISRDNVCLVHEIVAGLARKWSIEQIKEICSAIAKYTKDQTNNEAFQPRIYSKSKWQKALDRVTNFNKSSQYKSKRRNRKTWTWSQRATEELRSLKN